MKPQPEGILSGDTWVSPVKMGHWDAWTGKYTLYAFAVWNKSVVYIQIFFILWFNYHFASFSWGNWFFKL